MSLNINTNNRTAGAEWLISNQQIKQNENTVASDDW